MNETRMVMFEDHPLTLERRDGAWWASGDEVASALGYEDKRSVADLYRRHKREFLSCETTTIDVVENGGRLPPRRGNRRSVRIYSLRGLDLLAMFARTSVAVRFRRWVLDTLEALRAVPADRLAALESTLAALLEERKADRELIRQLGAISVASIGHAGKMLSTFARSPEAKAYRDARIREGRDAKALAAKNRILPLIDGNGANGNGKAGGAS